MSETMLGWCAGCGKIREPDTYATQDDVPFHTVDGWNPGLEQPEPRQCGPVLRFVDPPEQGEKK